MKLYFDMAIVDEYGKVHGKIRQELPGKAAFIGSRPVNDLKAGFLMGGTEAAIEMMRVREFRKSVLQAEAHRCGTRLAEHLEDREGWHGIERQERIEEMYK